MRANDKIGILDSHGISLIVHAILMTFLTLNVLVVEKCEDLSWFNFNFVKILKLL